MAFMSGWFRNTFLTSATSAATARTAMGLGASDTVTFGSVSPAISSFGGTARIRMADVRKDGAWLTAVDAAPGSSLLGLAATTAGVNLVGNAASGNAKTDYAQVDFVLPAWYVAGAAITIRIRAKTTALSQVSDKVSCSVKVAADGTLGSDIVASGSPSSQLTTSFANYDFVVTPTGRVVGETLTIRFATVLDDTGGAHGGIGTISAISVVLAAS